jgi:hypothetical protein
VPMVPVRLPRTVSSSVENQTAAADIFSDSRGSTATDSSRTTSLEFAAQRMALQLRASELTQAVQRAEVEQRQQPVTAAPSTATLDQVALASATPGERQGHARAMARQHVEFSLRDVTNATISAPNTVATTGAGSTTNATFVGSNSTGTVDVVDSARVPAPTRFDVAQLLGLVEQLRLTEILASDPQRLSFAPSTGPRLMMPSGLGALAQTVAAQSRSAQTEVSSRPSGAVRRDTGALATIDQSSPRALAHVAWSDRWLGRFAGAAPAQLASFAPAILGDRAPAPVFVAPRMKPGIAAAANEIALAQTPMQLANQPKRSAPSYLSTAVSDLPVVQSTSATTPSATEAIRYDDEAETPDDIFAAIASSASQSRGRGPRDNRAVTTPAVAQSTQIANAVVADAAPVIARNVSMRAASTGAGLSAGLSGSPFAPTLEDIGVLPAETTTAPVFDARAMSPSALMTAYLSGDSSDMLDVVSARSSSGLGYEQRSSDDGSRPAWVPESRVVRDFAPTWLMLADRFAQEQTRSSATEELGNTAAKFDGAVSQDSMASSSSVVPSTTERFIQPPLIGAEPLTSRSDVFDGNRSYELIELEVPTLLRNQETQAASFATADYRPGGFGRTALSWSQSQQNTSTDLTLDFLPPELIVAAQRFGLGPQAALLAARLSAAGPATIASLAGQVDLAFLQSPTVGGGGNQQMLGTGSNRMASNYEAVNASDFYGSEMPRREIAASVYAAADDSASTTPLQAANETVQEISPTTRQPRGAFLWPAATVAALGIKPEAITSDGQSRFSLAALEVLAAKAVAELGAYAKTAESGSVNGPTAMRSATGISATGINVVDVSTRPDLVQVAQRSTLASVQTERAAGTLAAAGLSSAEVSELAEGGVATAVAEQMTSLPISQQYSFRALYLRGVGSPSVRAAQALALVQRSGVLASNAPLHERAQLAWDAMPMLNSSIAMQQDVGSLRSLSAGDTDSRVMTLLADAAVASTMSISSRQPSLVALQHAIQSGTVSSSLAASAAPSLTSLIAPTRDDKTSDTKSSSSSNNNNGAVRRAPTAAPDMVRTGGSRSESDIPDWFEKAARKMFGEQTNTAADGLSLADLTLINNAPSTQIAASTKGESVSASATPSSASSATAAAEGEKFDVERIARDVYRAVMQIMDAARARNGEPYL